MVKRTTEANSNLAAARGELDGLTGTVTSTDLALERAIEAGEAGKVVALQAELAIAASGEQRAREAVSVAEQAVTVATREDARSERDAHMKAVSYDRFVAESKGDLDALRQALKAITRIHQRAEQQLQHLREAAQLERSHELDVTDTGGWRDRSAQMLVTSTIRQSAKPAELASLETAIIDIRRSEALSRALHLSESVDLNAGFTPARGTLEPTGTP